MARKKITPKVRKQVYERDNFTCHKCRKVAINIPKPYTGANTLFISTIEGKMQWLEIDHVVPYIKGGVCDISNYQTMCNSCNSSKGGK